MDGKKVRKTVLVERIEKEDPSGMQHASDDLRIFLKEFEVAFPGIVLKVR